MTNTATRAMFYELTVMPTQRWILTNMDSGTEISNTCVEFRLPYLDQRVFHCPLYVQVIQLWKQGTGNQ